MKYVSSYAKKLKMLVIGVMGQTFKDENITDMLLTEKEVEGNKVSFLDRTLYILKKNLGEKNNVTRNAIINAINSTVSEYFGPKYEEILQAG